MAFADTDEAFLVCLMLIASARCIQRLRGSSHEGGCLSWGERYRRVKFELSLGFEIEQQDG